MPITPLPAATRTQRPWKNGGGITREIAAYPENAGFNADWRISMANVSQSGPFSIFPGMDRILTILEGQMRLSIADHPPITLTANSSPHPFPADAPCTAEVIAPVLDLNVMTRRVEFTVDVLPLSLITSIKLALEAATSILFLAAGNLTAAGHSLGRHDALLITATPSITLTSTNAKLYLITLIPV